MLTISALNLETREPILKNFSYKFEKGKFYQIVAENGMGKTSFLRAITDLTSYQGQIRYDGKEFINSKDKIFYFESNNWLIPSLTAKDYLEMVKKQWNSTLSIEKEAKFLGVDKYWTVPIKKYSLGMKQKLIVTMYFLSNAEYFLMDEVINGLDKQSRLKVYSRLKKELQDRCILYTSHYSDKIEISPLIQLELENFTMRELQHELHQISK